MTNEDTFTPQTELEGTENRLTELMQEAENLVAEEYKGDITKEILEQDYYNSKVVELLPKYYPNAFQKVENEDGIALIETGKWKLNEYDLRWMSVVSDFGGFTKPEFWYEYERDFFSKEAHMVDDICKVIPSSPDPRIEILDTGMRSFLFAPLSRNGGLFFSAKGMTRCGNNGSMIDEPKSFIHKRDRTIPDSLRSLSEQEIDCLDKVLSFIEVLNETLTEELYESWLE